MTVHFDKVQINGSIYLFEPNDGSGYVIQHVPSYALYTIVDPNFLPVLKLLDSKKEVNAELSKAETSLLKEESLETMTSFLLDNGLLKECG